MTKYLFIATLGPVQDFIAASRRTRDLWFSSWLLSELARSAARQIRDHHGVLIFPAAESLVAGREVANKLVALVDDPHNVGAAIHRCIHERLQQIAKTYLPAQLRRDGTWKTALAQIADLPELIWAAAILPNEHGYPRVRRRVEALIAARKATRAFVQPTWRKDVPKSSLDGQRESVILEAYYDDPPTLWDIYQARPGERLSGVDLLKRHGRDNRNDPESVGFPSTSHIAALTLLRGIQQANVESARIEWKHLIAQIAALLPTRKQPTQRYTRRSPRILPRKVHRQVLNRISGRFARNRKRPDAAITGFYEADLLFEERIFELFPTKDDPRQAEAKQALTAFLKTIAAQQRPLPYYAILHADGDQMGTLIDAQTSSSAHRRLSTALSHFAAGVREIVEGTYHGALVYAGGDDVLAFLPLYSALECAKALADDFRQQLSVLWHKKRPLVKTRQRAYTHTQVIKAKQPRLLGKRTMLRNVAAQQAGRKPKHATPFVGKQRKRGSVKGATLSAGIAICHHLDPLSDALNLARAAEQKAKRMPGKNALAITLSKRSGADTTVYDHWEPLGERFRRFVSLYVNEQLPDAAAFDLRDLAERLTEVGPPTARNGDQSIASAGILAEALRMLKRKHGQRGGKPVAEAIYTQVQQDLTNLINVTGAPLAGLRALADALIVARILAQAKTIAGGD